MKKSNEKTVGVAPKEPKMKAFFSFLNKSPKSPKVKLGNKKLALKQSSPPKFEKIERVSSRELMEKLRKMQQEKQLQQAKDGQVQTEEDKRNLAQWMDNMKTTSGKPLNMIRSISEYDEAQSKLSITSTSSPPSPPAPDITDLMMGFKAKPLKKQPAAAAAAAAMAVRPRLVAKEEKPTEEKTVVSVGTTERPQVTRTERLNRTVDSWVEHKEAAYFEISSAADIKEAPEAKQTVFVELPGCRNCGCCCKMPQNKNISMQINYAGCSQRASPSLSSQSSLMSTLSVISGNSSRLSRVSVLSTLLGPVKKAWKDLVSHGSGGKEDSKKPQTTETCLGTSENTELK